MYGLFISVVPVVFGGAAENEELDAFMSCLKNVHYDLTSKKRPANWLRNYLRELEFNRWYDPEKYPYKT